MFEVGTPKGHKRRSVPFPRFLAEHLAKLCESKGPDDLVFPGHHGQFLRQPRVRGGADAETRARDSWFAAALQDAGAPRVTPHDLRHTAASFAVSAGANVKAVQRMLGHSSAAMTLDIYADLFDDDLNAVADRLDEVVSEQIVDKRGQTHDPRADEGRYSPGISREWRPSNMVPPVGLEPTTQRF
ncbi:tyrosine-type recombinase/integrase [Micrococcus sp. IITD107]|uniref:tyrosine-type recombinase/integrase n=1 Tax=Micrococcus sp. IITD107 TaxID=3342790 RepID=UPI0035B88C65